VAIVGVSGLTDALIAALLAPSCAVCSAILDRPTRGCVCEACWRTITPITPPVCDGCGQPLASRNRTACTPCSKSASEIRCARAIGEYEGALRGIVHELKYSGRLSLAGPLARLMRIRGRELLETADCAVPVPLHWRRHYQRGFNQAREIARHLGPPVLDALVRYRNTRPQIELAADRRRANVQHAFRPTRYRCSARGVCGKVVLLVDDVRTTGATLEACAVVLKGMGAAEIYALTAATVATPNP
jgi:ComF family protein